MLGILWISVSVSLKSSLRSMNLPGEKVEEKGRHVSFCWLLLLDLQVFGHNVVDYLASSHLAHKCNCTSCTGS